MKIKGMLPAAILLSVVISTGSDARDIRMKREAEETAILVDDIIGDLGPNKEIDLVLIIDRSTGMGKERFYTREKKILQALLMQYATLHQDYLRLAAITFAKHSSVDFDFISASSGITKCALFYGSQPPWRDLEYYADPSLAHGTNIYDAFNQADDILRTGRVNRPSVTSVILLVTDGDYGTGDQDPYSTAELLKNEGYKMYAMGIGSWLRPGNLRILASRAEYYAHYDDWEKMTFKNTTSLTAGTIPLIIT